MKSIKCHYKIEWIWWSSPFVVLHLRKIIYIKGKCLKDLCHGTLKKWLVIAVFLSDFYNENVENIYM